MGRHLTRLAVLVLLLLVVVHHDVRLHGDELLLVELFEVEQRELVKLLVAEQHLTPARTPHVKDHGTGVLPRKRAKCVGCSDRFGVASGFTWRTHRTDSDYFQFEQLVCVVVFFFYPVFALEFPFISLLKLANIGHMVQKLCGSHPVLEGTKHNMFTNE